MTHPLPDGNNPVLNVLENKYWTLHTTTIKTGSKDRKNKILKQNVLACVNDCKNITFFQQTFATTLFACCVIYCLQFDLVYILFIALFSFLCIHSIKISKTSFTSFKLKYFVTEIRCNDPSAPTTRFTGRVIIHKTSPVFANISNVTHVKTSRISMNLLSLYFDSS